jgi:hypothetical protein
MTTKLSRALIKLSEINVGLKYKWQCRRYARRIDLVKRSLGQERAGTSGAFRLGRNLYAKLRKRDPLSIGVDWLDEAPDG